MSLYPHKSNSFSGVCTPTSNDFTLSTGSFLPLLPLTSSTFSTTPAVLSVAPCDGDAEANSQHQGCRTPTPPPPQPRPLPNDTTAQEASSSPSPRSSCFRAAAGATVPLDRYRAKLEECAELHRSVAALTDEKTNVQRRLAEREAENAALRDVIAQLENQLRSEDGGHRTAGKCSGGGENSESGVAPKGSESGSVPVSLSQRQQPEHHERISRDSSDATLATSATVDNGNSSPKARADTPGGGEKTEADAVEGKKKVSCAKGLRVLPSRRLTARTLCVSVAQHHHQGELHAHSSRQVSAPIAHSHRVSSDVSDAASSSSCSSCSVYADGNINRPTRATRLTAAEVAAFVQAMGQIAEAPLGPWEEE